MKKTFQEALEELILEYKNEGTDVEEIISDLELAKMALEEDV